MLMTNVVMAISKYMPPDRMRLVPANCPAEVKFDMDIKTATHTGRPFSAAIMPNAKDTDRYPRQIGRPSFDPLRKAGSCLREEVDIGRSL